MRYPTRWVSNLEGETRRNFEGLLENNNKVLDRLVEICYNMINELEAMSSDFDTPNWALRQADLVGQRRSLQKVIQLCTPAPERDPVR
jgi:uncharacterized membrane protein YccC